MMKFRPKQGSNLIISKVGNNWTGVNDPSKKKLLKEVGLMGGPLSSIDSKCKQTVQQLLESCRQ